MKLFTKQGLKNWIKISLCDLMYYSGILELYLRLIFLTKKEYPLIIINYHAFVENLDQTIETKPGLSLPIEEFEKQIIFLKKYFKILLLDEAVSHIKAGKNFLEPVIAITVDDGYKDNYDLLFPVAKKYDVPVTIFITTGFPGTKKRIWVNEIGEMILKTSRKSFVANGIFEGKTFFTNSLQEKRKTYQEIVSKLKEVSISTREQYEKVLEEILGKPQVEERSMLSWEEILQMQKSRIDFGAHTVTHPILTNMQINEAKREILESKKMLEEHLGRPVKHFAFPNGTPKDFNNELIEFCKSIGFDSVSTSYVGGKDYMSDRWSLKRIAPESPLSLFIFLTVRALLKSSVKKDHA